MSWSALPCFTRSIPPCWIAAVIAGLASAGLAGGAQAQTAQDDSVTARSRPEYDAIGLSPADLLGFSNDRATMRGPLGVLDSFLLFPSLGVQYYTTDNVFKTTDAKVTDSVVRVYPALELRSDWTKHALNVGLHGDFQRYFDRESEDTNDWGVFTYGRLDISDVENLGLRVSHDMEHEERGNRDDVNGTEPTRFTADAGELDWRFQRDAIFTRFLFDSRHLRYLDTPSSLGIINQSDRNRWEYDPRFRLGYEAFEGTMFYVEPALSWRRYERDIDRNGENRDSTGRQILVGVTYDASAVTYLDLGVGYTARDYKDPLPSISGFDVRAQVTWNPLDQLTVNSSLSRSIEETTTAGVSGFFVTAGRASIDYEAAYNLILSTDTSYSLERGKARQGFAETDRIYGVGLGATFMVNEYMRTKAGYRFQRRDSNVVGLDYSENRVFIGVELQY